MSNPVIYEKNLYQPIKDYLISQGYDVYSEVKNCDITATKDDDLVIIEMKKALNLTVLAQATTRQKSSDSVYVAIIKPKGGISNKKWRTYIHLLKKLELGLLTVSFKKEIPTVTIIFHPVAFTKRKNSKMKRSIIKEINERHGDYNTGGVCKTKLVTAYKEKAIHIACALTMYGDLSPKALRALGTSEQTQSILYNNHYQWFERVSNGIYSITIKGKKESKSFTILYKYYQNQLKEKN